MNSCYFCGNPDVKGHTVQYIGGKGATALPACDDAVACQLRVDALKYPCELCGFRARTFQELVDHYQVHKDLMVLKGGS